MYFKRFFSTLNHALLTRNIDYALKQIKSLRTGIDSSDKIIVKSFQIYSNLDHKYKHCVVINELLKLWLKHDKYFIKKDLNIFNELCQDIIVNKHNVDKSLLMSFCKKLIEIDKTLTIKLLQFINNSGSKTMLIDIYSSTDKNTNDDLNTAMDIFKSIANNQKDMISIGAMMKCCINHEKYDESISLYHKYGIDDNVLHLLYIKSCINGDDYSYYYDLGKKVINKYFHVNILRKYDIEFITTIIQFYGHYGDVQLALNIFNSLPVYVKSNNEILLGVIMKIYNDNNQFDDTISLYQQQNIVNDNVLNTLFIKACINSNRYNEAIQLVNSIKFDLQSINELSSQLINSIIDFYGKCHDIDNALKIFNLIPFDCKDTVSINIMMNAYNNNNKSEQTIKIYEKHEELIDNNTTSNMLYLKACINSNNFEKGNKLIDGLDINIEIENTVFITSIIDFYGNFGYVDNALNVFNLLKKMDSVIIGAMMNVYNINKQYFDALQLFNKYKNECNAYCYSIVLDSCSNLFKPVYGLNIISDLHSNINNKELMNDYNVQAAIIRFYSKIGEKEKAINLFNNMDIKEHDNNVMIVYCAILDCYAKFGYIDELLLLFKKIKEKEKEKNGMIDDKIYCIVINGCCFGGKIDVAMDIFNGISNLTPMMISIIIDGLSRNNHLEKAENLYNIHCTNNKFLKNNKIKYHMLFAILSSCRIYNDILRAQRIFDEIMIDSDIMDTNDLYSAYILLSNIYAQNNKFDKVKQIDIEMREKGIKKNCFLSTTRK